MKIALFVTCFNDLLFPNVGRAVVRLLGRLGHQVEFPEGQTCCGQIHFNTGYRDACVPLVRRFTETFAGFDAVVTPSPSCAGMVRYGHATVAHHALERDLDRSLPSAVAELAPRVHELTEFLVDVLGMTDVGARFPHRVAYHATCHSQRILGLGDRPQRLLTEVAGLTLVALARADECCGFGGTFAVKNSETSMAIGQDKVRDVLDSGADILTAGDTSCLLHIGGILSRQGQKIRVLHLAEILGATGTDE